MTEGKKSIPLKIGIKLFGEFKRYCEHKRMRRNAVLEELLNKFLDEQDRKNSPLGRVVELNFKGVPSTALQKVNVSLSSHTVDRVREFASKTWLTANLVMLEVIHQAIHMEESEAAQFVRTADVERPKEQWAREAGEQFSERVRQAMTSQDLTQDDLAARMGVSRLTVSSILNMHRRPRRGRVEQAAEALGVHPQQLCPSYH